MKYSPKYPRTWHFPFSPGTTRDDKKAGPDLLEDIGAWELVITEKLDGENTCLCPSGVYARSHGAETRSPWSKNLWDPIDGLYWRIKNTIGESEALYGENLYGIHSIEYPDLHDYWHLIGVLDTDRETWYSWDEVGEFSEFLGVPRVPEIWRGQVKNLTELQGLIEEIMTEPSAYGPTKEGVVVRKTPSFRFDDFPRSVWKYVREGHVQTDTHWTKNWKKACIK